MHETLIKLLASENNTPKFFLLRGCNRHGGKNFHFGVENVTRLEHEERRVGVLASKGRDSKHAARKSHCAREQPECIEDAHSGGVRARIPLVEFEVFSNRRDRRILNRMQKTRRRYSQTYVRTLTERVIEII